MTLRPQFSLGHSEFNEFLFASVGEENNGTDLTVLSALARLGLDPWGEAARLSDLPRETAVLALITTFSRLPEGKWQTSDLQTIAARLTSRLPRRNAAAVPSPRNGADENRKVKSAAPIWLIFIMLAVAALFVLSRPPIDHDPEPVPTTISPPANKE